ncbi:Aromatic peroxygenase [Lecanosticta acicola]|uniref:Aromatic peroxygenase n=1 Tax=Lecanosticta acicola TaxID=111012 RepID=A0AAI8Z7B7_9PEZI|nr:Aromatic peroxygenase [Lecanosticta acicola]
MKCNPLLAGVFALQATAFPFVLMERAVEGMKEAANQHEERQIGGLVPANNPASAAAVQFSKSRSNCGIVPCTGFDPSPATACPLGVCSPGQLVSTTGDHAYASPLPNEIRGPCPGLNAAANHAYIPRSGVLSITQTIEGLAWAYNFGPDFSAFLAAYAVLTDGDPIAGTWSIGGPYQRASILEGTPQGISYSHNIYEADVSIGRADAYISSKYGLAPGDAHSLVISRFQSAYDATNLKVNGVGPADRYTLDAFAQNFGSKLNESIATNPYFFSAPFAGLVAPAAYNFVINFLAHCVLDSSMADFEFKKFFAVSGNSGNFKWNRGQERIPDNWYKRTSTNQYDAAEGVADVVAQYLAYPYEAKFGGNTGRVNTFTGLDLGNTFTSGNPGNLLEGNNLQCFFFNAAQAGIPDFAGDVLNAANAIVAKYISSVPAFAGCPQLGSFNQGVFSKYPGAKYQPNGPAQNY